MPPRRVVIQIAVVSVCIAILIILIALVVRPHLQPSSVQSTEPSATSSEPVGVIIPAPVTTSNVAAIVAGGPYQINVTTGITYATVNGETLTFDLYEPAGVTKPMPVIVYMHGGGFQAGDSEVGNAIAFANRLAARGYAVASVNYELSGTAIMPEPVYDIFAAIRFFRANATKYDFDPGRFATMGDSAGSVLATFVGVMADEPQFYGTIGTDLSESSTIQAIVAVSGEWYSTDFGELTPEHVATHEKELGCPDGLTTPDCEAKIHEYFPEFNLDSNDPPTIIFQGTADTATPPDNATNLTTAMKAAGIDVTLIMNPGVGHGAKNALQNLPQLYSFLDTTFEK